MGHPVTFYEEFIKTFVTFNMSQGSAELAQMQFHLRSQEKNIPIWIVRNLQMHKSVTVRYIIPQFSQNAE